MEQVLRMEAVSKDFPVSGQHCPRSAGHTGSHGGIRELHAVRSVSLSVQRGEAVAVVGESGCGKSTLARMAAGILPVSGGKVWLLGQETGNFSRSQWRECWKVVQMVFQNPSGIISPRMKIGTFLREPFRNFFLCPRQETGGQVSRLLEKVGLDDSFLHKYPHQLSGGELQRVAIARALAVHPALLICDEPTSALDAAIQAQIIGLLQKLRQEENIAVLFISHDLALVQHFADRILVMYLGEVVEELPADGLKDALHPYTRALIGSVFRLDSRAEIRPLEGEPPSPFDLPEGCPFYSRCPVRQERCAREHPQLTLCGERHRAACFAANRQQGI